MNRSDLPIQLKRKWIQALRSGRYEQGSGRLRTYTDKYCCLGVLLDVIDPSRWIKIENGIGTGGYRWDNSFATLPTEIADEYFDGFDTVRIVTFETKNIDGDVQKMCSLTECNDAARYTFEQIATIIEMEL